MTTEDEHKAALDAALAPVAEQAKAAADATVHDLMPMLQDLLELERAGALGGIRAVIAERLAIARKHETDGWWDIPDSAVQQISFGEYARAAALLARRLT